MLLAFVLEGSEVSQGAWNSQVIKNVFFIILD